MNWQEILTILVPIFGLMGWVYSRIEKKIEAQSAATDARFDKVDARFDKVDARFEKMEARFEKIDARFDKIEVKLQSIDNRLTRLEGRFDERGYWEARVLTRTGTDDVDSVKD